jgi:ATP-dependent helicase HepA
MTDIVEALVTVAEKKAERIGAARLEQAEEKVMEDLKREYQRLKALREVNPSIREEELDFIAERLEAMLFAIEESRTRLDAVHLIMMTP